MLKAVITTHGTRGTCPLISFPSETSGTFQLGKISALSSFSATSSKMEKPHSAHLNGRMASTGAGSTFQYADNLSKLMNYPKLSLGECSKDTMGIVVDRDKMARRSTSIQSNRRCSDA
jgi:hypothetical protein